jgi:hypothetical protein
MFNKVFSRRSCRLLGNVEKRGAAGEATNDNMEHARCMLDKQGYMPQAHAHAPGHPTTHTHINMKYLLFCISGFANAPQCYVIVHCLSCHSLRQHLHRSNRH